MKRLTVPLICLPVLIALASCTIAQAQTETAVSASTSNACYMLPAWPGWVPTPPMALGLNNDVAKEIQRHTDQMNRLLAQQRDAMWDAATGPISDQECKETEKELVYTVELPGFSKTDLALTLEGHGLVLHAATKEHQEESAPGYQCGMQSSRSAHRTFSLPSNVDRDKITAAFEKGVLTIHVPKTTSKVEPKVIRIK